MLIRWKPAFEIDNGIVDDDHKAIISSLNEILSALEDGAAAGPVAQMIADLRRFAAQHFQREEELQQLLRFPDATAHHQEHCALLQELDSIWAACNSNDARTAPRDAARFKPALYKWILNHILTSDLEMRPYISSCRGTASTRSTVVVLTDTPAELNRLKRSLRAKFEVTGALVADRPPSGIRAEALIVSINLKDLEAVNIARKFVTSCLNKIDHRLFLTEEMSHHSTSQALAIGATLVLEKSSLPAKLDEIFAGKSTAAGVIMQRLSLDESVSWSAQRLFAMISAVQTGRPIDLSELESDADLIIDGLSRHGLSQWLDYVRRHHEGTYQHCLLVAGVLVDFGFSLGARKSDVRNLYISAMLHDLGKANIPLEVLQKAGSLDENERSTIELHPALGFTALRGADGLDSEVLDAVLHHHEYLDGSGYPDKLSGNEISDVARMLTIADIFAALVERRSYKAPMQRSQAYDILQSMKTKLEIPLVGAFKKVALGR